MRWTALMLLVGARPFCRPAIDPGPALAVQAAQPVPITWQEADSGEALLFEAHLAVGSADDPTGQEGLTSLVLHHLGSDGAGERDLPALSAALASVRGVLDVRVEREHSVVRLQCQQEPQTCTKLFADLLTAPRFSDEALARGAGHTASTLQSPSLRPLDSDQPAPWELLDRLLYQGHPYAHPPAGRWGVLPTLGTVDATAWTRRHLVRAATSITVVGQRDEAVARRLADLMLAMPTRPAPERVLQRPVDAGGPQALVVRSDEPVGVAWLGLPHQATRGSDDRLDLELAAAVLAERLDQPVFTTATPLEWPYRQPSAVAERQQLHLIVQITPHEGDDLPTTLLAAHAALLAWRDNGPTADEISRAAAARGLASPAVERVADTVRRQLAPQQLALAVLTDHPEDIARAIGEDTGDERVQASLALPASRLHLTSLDQVFR